MENTKHLYHHYLSTLFFLFYLHFSELYVLSIPQACTEMVMPMTCSNESMFPPYSYSYEAFEDQCKAKYGVLPRSHWITTEYGGNVRQSHFVDTTFLSFPLIYFWVFFYLKNFPTHINAQKCSRWLLLTENWASIKEIRKQHHLL